MPVDRRWKPARFASEASGWAAREDNRDLMLDQPTAEVAAYLDGSGELTKAVFRLRYLALWFEMRGIAGLYYGERSAGDDFRLSFEIERWYATLLSVTFKRREPKRKGATFPLAEHAYPLAKGIALGRFDDASALGRHLLVAAREGAYVEPWPTTMRAATFVVRLFCDWQRLEVPASIPSDLPDFYATILDRWRETESRPLVDALLGACDHHAAHSRYDNDETHFEFSSVVYRLFPAEILMVLRLREAMGLSVPELDHPVLTTPTARLLEPSPPPSFPLLDAMVEKAARELGLATWDVDVPPSASPNAGVARAVTPPRRTREAIDRVRSELAAELTPEQETALELLALFDVGDEGAQAAREGWDLGETDEARARSMIYYGITDAPGAIATDWRFDPGEKVEVIADRLRELGVELSLEDEDSEGLRVRWETSLEGPHFFHWNRPAEVDPDELVFALAGCLPDSVAIYGHGENGLSDTFIHVVASTETWARARRILGERFDTVFCRRGAGSTFVRDGP